MSTLSMEPPARDWVFINSPFRLKFIILAVGLCMGVSPETIKGRSRLKQHALARKIVYYLARERTRLSSNEIGRRMDRDHSTVLHGAKWARNKLAEGDADLERIINAVEVRLREGRI